MDLISAGVGAYSAYSGYKRQRLMDSQNQALVDQAYRSTESRHLGPKIRRPPPPRKPSKYELFGSLGKDETYGNITQPNIAYIGVTSAKVTGGGAEGADVASWSGSVVYHVAASLLRYILKKEWNYEVARHDETINIGNRLDTDFGGDTSGKQIYFVWQDNPTTMGLTTTRPTYGVYRLNLWNTSTVGYSKSFGTCARELADSVLCSSAFGGTYDSVSRNTRSLYGYSVHDVVHDGDLFTNSHGGVRRLENFFVKAYSTAVLRLQNSTIADTAGADGQYLDNRIDANPLNCSIFKFSTPFPTPRMDNGAHIYPDNNDTTYIINPQPGGITNTDYSYQLQFDRNGDGVIRPPNAMGRSWTMMPVPGFFTKCTGYGKFVMSPGSIRAHKLMFKFDGNLNNFIKGFSTINDGQSVRFNGPGALGTSVLIAMEKVMSVGADTNVSVNYSLDYHAGAYIKKVKSAVIQPYNITTTHVPGSINNGGGTITLGTYTGAVDLIV